VNVTPVTASHVKVGEVVERTGPGAVVDPGPITTGAGSVAGAWKYRAVLAGL
jgi:hypothetical protein